MVRTNREVGQTLEVNLLVLVMKMDHLYRMENTSVTKALLVVNRGKAMLQALKGQDQILVLVTQPLPRTTHPPMTVAMIVDIHMSMGS
jgi:hypothetical protein